MSGLCVHLYVIDSVFNSKILIDKKESTCSWCGADGPNLWMCLFQGCYKVGCGESGNNHSYTHNAHMPSHCIAINLSNLKAWCYMCEMEVTSWVISKLNASPNQLPHLSASTTSSSGVAAARPLTPNESSAEEDGDENKLPEEEDIKPRGLVGLRNLGLTCYMNAALQALSNSVPLSRFMKDCPASFLRTDRKQPGITRPFHRLILEMWHFKRPSYVAPSLVYHSFRTLYPMFRPYTQQDSQEFLRYFMDQLHEELRQPHIPLANHSNLSEEEDENDGQDTSSSMENITDNNDSEDSSPSDADEYETCDSGVSDKSYDSSNNSGRSTSPLQHKSKKKKRFHSPSYEKNRWKCYRVGSSDHDQSEFSDAMSDTSLLDATGTKRLTENTNCNLLRPTSSTTTSGLGSSKPSISSLSSSCISKSGLFISDKNHSQRLNLGNKPPSGTKINCNTLKPNNVGARKKKLIRYKSIISDCFDGVLVSSVQCLTCNTTSSRRETFQDLSLPIPSSDQLNLLHQHSPQQMPHTNISTNQNSSFNIYLSKNACDVTGEGWVWLWMSSLWGWVRSWLWGPRVSLLNCLAAFFSADELKGDNMYSCEKCGKLRNGVKYSKVIQLPEVLIIHLKRFRHEYMFSSKISQYVSFPLFGLDASPFLHKDCTSEVRTYDLYSVICHHGAVGSGHYTAYAQNFSNNRWYEFDDQCVTEVSLETVANCEAYVLFYKKVSPEMGSRRQRTGELMQVSSREPSLMQFYVSKQWMNKFNTFAEPGPIDNSDFLCPHGGIQPSKASYVGDLVMVFNQGIWEYLHQVFGGGPACTSLYECVTCREEQDALLHRQKLEYETFIQLHKLFQEEDKPNVVYAISMRWFRTWESFVRGRQQEPPGPLDNSSICLKIHGQNSLKPGSDYAPISKEMWCFFSDIYGGGPELFIRYGNPNTSSQSYQERRVSHCPKTNNSTESKKQQYFRLPYGLKSLSTDDIPYSLALSEQSPGLMRQRTVSASEVTSAWVRSHSNLEDGRQSLSCSSSEDLDSCETVSNNNRKVIKWINVEKEEEEETEADNAEVKGSQFNGGQVFVDEVQFNISRPQTRAYTNSFKSCNYH